MELLWVVAGVAVLGVVAVDLFRTVLDYGGYGPVSIRLYRGMWRVVRSVAGERPTGMRAGFLAAAGPLMLLASVAVWITLAAVGFALIYLAGMPDAFSFQGGPDVPVFDALYFSLVSLSTVGFGDIVATQPALRIVSALESLTGFAILTLTLSYLLGVYQVVRSQSILAALIDDQAGHEGGGLALATSLLRHDSTDASLTELHRDLITHNEGLHRYPIAYYFRRRDARRSALFVLRLVGEAAAFMRWVLPADHPSSQSPALDGVITAERRLIDDVRDRFLQRDVSDVTTDRLEKRWRAAAEHLRALDVAHDAPASEDGRRDAWMTFTAELEAVVRAASRELRFDERELGEPGG